MGGCPESDSNLLESLQIEGARVVTGALKGTNRVLNDLSVRRKIHKLNLVYKMIVTVSVPLTISVYPKFVRVGTKNRFSFRQLNGVTVFS